MAREVVVSCDIGGEPDAVEYTITFDSVTYHIDLCRIHAQPVIELAEQGRKSSSARPPRGGGANTRSLDRRIRGVPEINPDK